MSHKGDEKFKEYMFEIKQEPKRDMRYRIICSFPGCSKKLGDWALHVPVNKRLCYDHKKWDLKKETSHLKPTSPSNASKQTLGDV